MSARPDPLIVDVKQPLRTGDQLWLPRSDCHVTFKIDPDATQSHVVYHSPAPTVDMTQASGVFVTPATSAGGPSITFTNSNNVAEAGAFLNVGVMIGGEGWNSPRSFVPRSTTAQSSRTMGSASCKVSVVVPESQPLDELIVISQGATRITNPRNTGWVKCLGIVNGPHSITCPDLHVESVGQRGTTGEVKIHMGRFPNDGAWFLGTDVQMDLSVIGGPNDRSDKSRIRAKKDVREPENPHASGEKDLERGVRRLHRRLRWQRVSLMSKTGDIEAKFVLSETGEKLPPAGSPVSVVQGSDVEDEDGWAEVDREPSPEAPTAGLSVTVERGASSGATFSSNRLDFGLPPGAWVVKLERSDAIKLPSFQVTSLSSPPSTEGNVPPQTAVPLPKQSSRWAKLGASFAPLLPSLNNASQSSSSQRPRVRISGNVNNIGEGSFVSLGASGSLLDDIEEKVTVRGPPQIQAGSNPPAPHGRLHIKVPEGAGEIKELVFSGASNVSRDGSSDQRAWAESVLVNLTEP